MAVVDRSRDGNDDQLRGGQLANIASEFDCGFGQVFGLAFASIVNATLESFYFGVVDIKTNY